MRADVRFGSKADMCSAKRNVCFTPDCDRKSRHHRLTGRMVLKAGTPGNLRAVQLLLGHTKIESTVRYLGIDVDDALAIAEQDHRLKVPGRAEVLGPSLTYHVRYFDRFRGKADIA